MTRFTFATLLALLVPAAARAADDWVDEFVFPATKDLVVHDADGKPIGKWPARWGLVVAEKGDRIQVRLFTHPAPSRAWVKKSEVVREEDAEEFFTKKIKADAKDTWALRNRAALRMIDEDYERATSDLTAAIKAEPSAGLLTDRASVYADQAQYAKATKDFEEAVKLDPKDPEAANSFAWLLCTCPQEKYRNGKRAVELAKVAVELTESKNPYHIDTLGAAYAEVGEFDKAIEFQKKALKDQDFNMDFGDEARERLDLYEMKKPFRQTPAVDK